MALIDGRDAAVLGAVKPLPQRARHVDVIVRPARAGRGWEDAPIRTLQAQARIPGNFLRPETYFITRAVFVNNQSFLDQALDCFSLLVHDAGSKFAASEGVDYGCVFAACEWTVTDAGLPHLQRFKNLKSVRLAKTRVTDKGLAAFQQSLPNIEIETDPGDPIVDPR